MADSLEALPEKVNAIEQKLDALTASVDVRFDEVTAAFVEQREYTEFVFGRLRGELLTGFASMTTNFGRLERKLDHLLDPAGGHRPDT
jgi:hypothetical protein